MEQLICIVQKSNVNNDALFESQLVTSRSGTTFRGYQQTYPECLYAMKSDTSGAAAGSVYVTLDGTPVVTKL